MENVEMQIRVPGQELQTTYPLLLDQKLKQGDAYRRARDGLESRLKSVNDSFASSQAPPHTGEPSCACCISKKRQIRDAFRDYYLSSEQGGWESSNIRYQKIISGMASTDGSFSLEQVHEVYEAALRDHLQLDFCTPEQRDDSSTLKFKNEVADMFHNNLPLDDIIVAYANSQINSLGFSDARDFQIQLQNTREPEARALLFSRYYCSIEATDSQAIKSLKNKYSRQFQELLSHDTVLENMRREASRLRDHEMQSLKSKINELQMAKSASTKEKKRRAEQANQRLLEKDAAKARYATCALPSCTQTVDLFEETIECAVCDWLATKDAQQSRVYYCSLAHADDDFDKHDSTSHRCCMGSHCHSSLHGGPPRDTLDSGVCVDCTRNGVTSYFCSSQCFELNMKSHQHTLHPTFDELSSRLEHFKPANDLTVISDMS